MICNVMMMMRNKLANESSREAPIEGSASSVTDWMMTLHVNEPGSNVNSYKSNLKRINEVQHNMKDGFCDQDERLSFERKRKSKLT